MSSKGLAPGNLTNINVEKWKNISLSVRRLITVWFNMQQDVCQNPVFDFSEWALWLLRTWRRSQNTHSDWHCLSTNGAYAELHTAWSARASLSHFWPYDHRLTYGLQEFFLLNDYKSVPSNVCTLRWHLATHWHCSLWASKGGINLPTSPEAVFS